MRKFFLIRFVMPKVKFYHLFCDKSRRKNNKNSRILDMNFGKFFLFLPFPMLQLQNEKLYVRNM